MPFVITFAQEKTIKSSTWTTNQFLSPLHTWKVSLYFIIGAIDVQKSLYLNDDLFFYRTLTPTQLFHQRPRRVRSMFTLFNSLFGLRHQGPRALLYDMPYRHEKEKKNNIGSVPKWSCQKIRLNITKYVFKMKQQVCNNSAIALVQRFICIFTSGMGICSCIQK